MSKRYPGGIIRKTPQTPSQTSAQGIWDMASVTQAVKENTWPIAGVPDPISRSLRFRSSASANLRRTPTVTSNQRTWTWSGWIKRGSLTSDQMFFSASNTYIRFGNGADDTLWLNFRGTGGTNYFFQTTQVFRDPAAWYHIVLAVDTTQATASNRVKLYSNGVQITAFTTYADYPPQNTDTAVNSTTAHTLGSYSSNSIYFDGYMTEVYLIDGQALTPSSFGNTNDQTGVWQPIAYTGTYGTNGFYLPFSNTSSTATLGYDFSGNSNNWTTNNISLTSGSTYDSMVDVPTQWIPYNTAGDTGALYRGNYCTLNPLDYGSRSTSTFGGGNLNVSNSNGGSADSLYRSTFGLSSGKWYFETVFTTIYNTEGFVGICRGADYFTLKLNSNPYYNGSLIYYAYSADGNKYDSGSATSYGATWTANDVIGVAFDADAGTIVFYKNGVSQGTAYSGLSGTWFPVILNGGGNSAIVVNFGQRPFAYAPPSGFKTLNTTNLPTPTIGTTSTTQAADFFDVLTYTGAGGTQTISGLQFQPDLIWGKARSAAYSNALFDSVRGYGSTKGLISNATSAQGTVSAQYGFVSTNTSTGFTAAAGTDGSNPNAALNESGVTYVAWNWRANGAGSSNTAGSITSTVSANTTSGFSIVTFASQPSGSATIGHGLGVAPRMVIWKSSNETTAWAIYHADLGANKYINLDNTNAAVTAVNVWNNTAPTSTVFSTGSDLANYGNIVAYCFAEIAGYSKIGSYVGNDSADGTFIYTGFRPAFILYKKATGVDGWVIFDVKRNTYNVVDTALQPNTGGAEASSAAGSLDIVSNGFKQRNANNIANSSSFTYIYMAFAESPFKYALAR